MHVISIRKLQDFWEKHPETKGALEAWYNEAKHADWRTPEDIRKRYRSADFLPDNRVVFNIKGNACRLIVCVHYQTSRKAPAFRCGDIRQGGKGTCIIQMLVV